MVVYNGKGGSESYYSRDGLAQLQEAWGVQVKVNVQWMTIEETKAGIPCL